MVPLEEEEWVLWGLRLLSQELGFRGFHGMARGQWRVLLEFR